MNKELKKERGIGAFLKNNSFVILAGFCTAIIMLVVYFCYELVPFGDKTILRMDMYHQYGPLFAEFYERLTGGDSLLYSWTSGLGGSFLGNFLNYLSSPFLIVVMLFGHENIPEAIATMILLKAVFASGAFTWYLKISHKVHDATSAGFGVLYSCCGFFIAYYWNVMWLDAFWLFPLVILGIEKIINEGKIKLFLSALVVTLLTNYYMAYMVCIFSVIYFIAYFVAHANITDKFADLVYEDGARPSLRKRISAAIKNSVLIDRCARFAAAALSAGLVCAGVLVPLYFILKACSATSGTWPETYKSYFSIFDFLANSLASVDPTIRSSGEDVLPNIYCGILPLMLVPLYLFSKKIPLKEKLTDIAMLAILFFSFNVNYLNYIWHGFHFPNDLPYRFSFIYSFVILTMAFKAFKNIGEFSKRQILGAGVGLIAFIILVQEIKSKNVDELSVWISIIFVVFYCVAFGIMGNPKYHKTAISALLLCCICAEYTVANTDNYSMDQPKEAYVGDLDDFRTAKARLDEYDQSDFYRMELTSLRTRMDPSWYYYNGASIFSSMAYESLSNLQSKVGMVGNYINSYTYNSQTPVYNAMFSMKYLFDNRTTQRVNPEFFKELFVEGKYNALENIYYLPIAYRVNSAVKSWEPISISNPFDAQSDYFAAATGIPGVFDKLPIFVEDSTNLDQIWDSDLETGNITFFRTQKDSDASLTIDISVEKQQNVYLYVKSSNIKSIQVNGSMSSQTQNIERPYILDVGLQPAGTQISVEMDIDNGNSGYIYFYAVGVNEAAFKEGYEILKADSLQVESFEETHIKGKLNASADGLVYTSIPYDEGWSVYVDGQKVDVSQYVKIGTALLGVDITAGEHSIEFKYSPKGMSFGAICSLFMALILIVLLIMQKQGTIKKSKPLRALCPVEEMPLDDATGSEFPELPLPDVAEAQDAEVESTEDSAESETDTQPENKED